MENQTHRPLSPRGRGTGWNPANRFEGTYTQAEPESRTWVEEDDDLAPRPETEYIDENASSILVHNDSPDVNFDWGINPYRGCEHGCIYCYARPMHEYMGYSAGLDFETKIFVKRRAPQLLREALASRKWTPEVIALSGATDPYQPVERTLKLTRGCLEVLAEFRNPVGIITKNRLVTRDIDLLAPMAADQCATVSVSVTTLDLQLNRILEPRTSSPHQRLDAIRALSESGIPVRVLVAPVIPGITDHEIPAILQAAAAAGATSASYIMLRLPHAVAPLFEAWLEEHYPDRKEKVLSRLRAMREGRLYRSDFATRHSGTGVFAEQTARFFEVACRKAGLDRAGKPLSIAQFRRPGVDQMELFA
jgi:DNA repair photolyase